MNYEHNDGFEELPGKNQRNGSVREGGRAGQRMQGDPTRPRERNVQRTGGIGQEAPRRPQREENYQGRPARRQEPGPQEGYGMAGGRRAAGGNTGTGRVPGMGRQQEGYEGQGIRRAPQGARPAGAGRVSGTGRLPGGLNEGGNRTGRQPEGVNIPARQPGTGKLPGSGDGIRGISGPGNNIAARETAAGSESRAAGTGRGKRTVGAAAETPREALAQAKIQRAKQKKKRIRILAMILAECLTLTVIFTYAYFARRLNMIQRDDFNKEDVRNEALSVDDITKMKGYWLIAVFGVDSRSTNVSAGVQADVNMICCINQDTGEIKLVSVYRDTYLNINDSNSYRKLNAAYTNGGPEQALKTLNKNLDLDITDYVTFSWKAVAEGINILGGVDVEITRSEFRFINAFITETVEATNIGSHQLPSPGLHHLDGVQAVAYGRLRLMDTDYARTERQRKIIELAFAKAKQADYPTLNNILVTTLPSISTNLDFTDLTNLALSIGKYHIGETAGFPFAKGNANIPGKGDCVIPQTLESNVSQLHTFLFGDESYTPTEKVRQISSKIAADSGMHREGKPSTGSALATDSYVPETTAKASTEAATTQAVSTEEESEPGRVLETDGNGNLILDPNMTDADGNLIDAPIDDWPEEPDYPYPGGQNNGQNGDGPSGPSSTRPSEARPGQTESRVPESSSGGEGRVPGNSGSTTPGSETSGSGGTSPGQNTGPGANLGPGANTGSTSETVSAGGNSPGRTDPSSEGPSGTGSPGAGSSGTGSPGTGSSGTDSPGAGSSGTGAGGAVGPGSATQGIPSPQESSPRQTAASQEASQPSGQNGAGSSPGPGGGESEQQGPQGPGV